MISYLAGAPVRLQFMRWDEHGWDNYAPAQMMDVRGGVDAGGTSPRTDFTPLLDPVSREPTPASSHSVLQPAPLGFNFIDATNMGAQYKIPNQRVTLKVLPLLNQYFKSSFMRAPFAPAAVFGYEQLIDELAYAAKMDPVAFRLQNITSNANETQNNLPFTWDRWKNVLTEVAKISNWKAQGRQLDRPDRQRRHGSRDRPRRVRRHDGGGRRRRLGEQEVRQDHRDAPLRRAGHRPDRSTPAASRTRPSAA